MRVTLYLEESGSPILYHATTLSAAARILQSKNFELKPTEGTAQEEKLSAPAYYMSTTRHRLGGYTRSSMWSHTVIFVLDGKKLGQRYAVKPVDYWGDMQRDVEKREAEDRILSKSPKIPAAPYTLEIHARVDNDSDAKYAMAVAAKKLRIPLYWYDDERAMLLMNKRKAVPISLKQLAPKNLQLRSVHYRRSTGGLKAWHALWKAPAPENRDARWSFVKQKMGDNSYRAYRILGDGIRGALPSFSADLHNAKGDPYGSGRDRETLDEIVKVMRRNRWSATQFLQALYEKWYGK